MNRRVVAVCLITLALLLIPAAVLLRESPLTHLGAENHSVRAFDLRFQNITADTTFYLVNANAAADESTVLDLFNAARFFVGPGESRDFAVGPDPRVTDDRCFVNEQFWVLRSISGAMYAGPSAVPLEKADLEVVRHIGPDTCLNDANSKADTVVVVLSG